MAIDTRTTTTSITVAKSLIDAIDARIEAGEFADRDEVVSVALVRFLERCARYDAMIQEGLDDIAAGRVMEATPDFYRGIIDEVEADIAAGRPFHYDEFVLGPKDDD